MKIVRVIGIVIGSIAGLLLVMMLANLSMTAWEKHRYPAPGRLVEVGGQRMHLLTVGSGPHNVLLLCGLGTVSPVADFSPLVSNLKQDFQVSVVEYLGYGWSDWTDKPRTNKAIIDEVRTVLKKAGIMPPYIVVPHSLSGIYTLYWSSAYPEEISAVVALDTTVPLQIGYLSRKGFSPIFGVARVLGIVRAALLVDPGLSGYATPAYSEEQRQTVRRMASWSYLNRTIMEERSRAYENIEEVKDFRYPAQTPVSMILAKDTIEMFGRATPPLDWVKAHAQIVAGNPRAKIHIVDGDHNVHWNNSGIIADIVRRTAAEAALIGPEKPGR